jgi:hypothetical protein
MKLKLLTYVSIGLAAGLIAGCNSGDHPSGSVTPPPTPQKLDTQAVLALAEKTSESASPFAVNGGLVSFTDTSESTSPISVNGM